MHKLQMYENLMDMLEREVKEISNKSNLDQQTLDNLYKVMMSIKATDKHMETLEGGMSQERSYERSRRSRDGSYGRSNDMYERSNGESYDYERSRDNFRDSSYRGREYSRDNARQKLINKMTTLMDDTMSESERQAISDCIEKLR